MNHVKLMNMNRRLNRSCLLLLILGGFMCVDAQTTPISAAEFEKIASSAYAKTATRHRRETTNAKKFRDGRVIEEELTTQDFAPPDKERWLILARTPEKNTRIEIVYIGDVEYRREDKNPWKKIDAADSKVTATYVATAPSAKSKGTTTYTKEDKAIDGMRLQVYSERSQLRRRTIMMDAYGYILTVEESVSEGSPDNVVYTSKLSIVFSSNPIIIEAPIN